MAISQRYKHRQFLLVEPLLRVYWLLLSLNGLDSLKAEALVLDVGLHGTFSSFAEKKNLRHFLWTLPCERRGGIPIS